MFFPDSGAKRTAGEVTWHVVATDARGNVGRSEQRAVTVQTCVF